ncbi:MAG: class I SAM-dependent methyltransferase [Acidobacteria bacterium]|nr:MAG: class I SAM-dependent methyltransferase [Acidobacteriota bacterium]MCE7959824.1 class I SAM-dependent methyltransferase [Acidobacteria bacterium ACB2]
MIPDDGSLTGAAPRRPLLAGPEGHVCPWWIGALLCCPVRKLVEPPGRLLGPHVRPGMTVLEPGCGMGFFSLPLARMVGPQGKVVCVDLQPKMIEGLRRRARRAGLSDRVEASVCTGADLGVERHAGRFDLAVAVHMLHEVARPEAFLAQVFAALRPGGSLLVLEPRGHVSREALEASLALAETTGFVASPGRAARRELSALLRKPEEAS